MYASERRQYQTFQRGQKRLPSASQQLKSSLYTKTISLNAHKPRLRSGCSRNTVSLSRRDICRASLLPSRDAIPRAPAPISLAGWAGQRLAPQNSARPLLPACGLVRMPAVTDCLQGTAPVEQAALGAFAEMLGTHIRLFHESDSDTRLFT